MYQDILLQSMENFTNKLDKYISRNILRSLKAQNWKVVKYEFMIEL